jgi:hypothetical protein
MSRQTKWRRDNESRISFDNGVLNSLKRLEREKKIFRTVIHE